MAAPPPTWEADVIARDGTSLHVRGILPSDAAALQELHSGQSESSRVFRFFAPKGPFTESELRHFTTVDGRERVALVVTEPGRQAPLLAVARYDRFDDDAEVAFYVSDTQHGRGLGSLLLDHLATIGRGYGITRFVADVLPSNGRMLAVFKDAGYTLAAAMEDGVVGVVLDLESTPRSREVAEARERYSEARSMIPVLSPRAVVRLPGESLPADVSGVLVIVGGGADGVVSSLAHLADAGVGAAVVSAGSGVVDGAWHRAIAAVSRPMRLVGPGSFGILTTDGVNATLEPRLHGGGELAVFAQSSDSARALAEDCVAAGVALAAFLAAGHRLDVSGNDVMQFLIGRQGVRAAIVCLDSIGNPRKFARIARRLASEVPLICHVSSQTGQQAPPGHPVRTSPLPRDVLSAMLRQAGVVEAERREDLLPLARLAMSGALRNESLEMNTDLVVGLGDGPSIPAPDAQTGERWVRALRTTPEPSPLVPDPDGVRPGIVRRLLLGAADGPADADAKDVIAEAYGLPRALDVAIDAFEDPLYGPVVAVGREHRLVPLGVGTPQEMLAAARVSPAHSDALVRIARLIEDHPRITRLRLGPDGFDAAIGPVPRPRRARGARVAPSFPSEPG